MSKNPVALLSVYEKTTSRRLLDGVFATRTHRMVPWFIPDAVGRGFFGH